MHKKTLYYCFAIIVTVILSGCVGETDKKKKSPSPTAITFHAPASVVVAEPAEEEVVQITIENNDTAGSSEQPTFTLGEDGGTGETATIVTGGPPPESRPGKLEIVYVQFKQIEEETLCREGDFYVVFRCKPSGGSSCDTLVWFPLIDTGDHEAVVEEVPRGKERRQVRRWAGLKGQPVSSIQRVTLFPDKVYDAPGTGNIISVLERQGRKHLFRVSESREVVGCKG